MKTVLNKPTLLLIPVPIAIVSVGCETLGDNLIAISWIGVAASEPPQIAIGVRRNNRFSYKHLIENGEFGVNIPIEDIVSAAASTGRLHGDKVDKWVEAGFTRMKAVEISVPLVAECPINMECVVRHRLELGSHDLFIGEVVASHAEDSILKDGVIDIDNIAPLVYLPSTGKYFGLKRPEVFSH